MQAFDKSNPLSTLLHCLEQFEYTDWSAYVFITDTTPVPQLKNITKARRPPHGNKIKFVDDIPFHLPWACSGDCGYNSTDWVIYHKCPPHTKWLLVTNGDNDYHPQFLNYLDTKYDMIGFDFMHRDVFDEERSNDTVDDFLATVPCGNIYKDSCKIAKWVWGRVDLGSVVWNFERWKVEHRNYSVYTPTCCHDGSMAESTVKNGWRDLLVHECLFSHNPTLWVECRHDLMGNQVKEEPSSI